MARIGRRSSFSICAVLVLSYATVSAAQSGQQIPALFNIFGGLISTAIVDAARRDWQARPLSDYNCLARHGVSAGQLASSGIGPDDPRVRQYFSECASAAPATPVAPVPVPVAPQPATGAVAGPASSKYVVNGLTLGASFSPQADAAAGYACRASEDFPGFAWCQSHHADSRKLGSQTTWMSVFRSEANAAVEITQTVEPAFFRQGDAEREIQRLSREFAQQARVIGADLPAGGHAVIAAWGAVTLVPLAPPVLDALRRAGPVHSGLLVSALADPRAAARLGLPVYSLGGGAGFIWCADYNSSGKGVLRIIAADPGALKSAPPSQPRRIGAIARRGDVRRSRTARCADADFGLRRPVASKRSPLPRPVPQTGPHQAVRLRVRPKKRRSSSSRPGYCRRPRLPPRRPATVSRWSSPTGHIPKPGLRTRPSTPTSLRAVLRRSASRLW